MLTLQWDVHPRAKVWGRDVLSSVSHGLYQDTILQDLQATSTMDAILNYTKDPASDYYHLIGCNELSSMEQILTEYKVRVLQCHPDKHPDNPTADKQFRMLQRAREVLGDPEMRAHYDKWCHAGVALHFEQWLALSSSVKPVTPMNLLHMVVFFGQLTHLQSCCASLETMRCDCTIGET